MRRSGLFSRLAAGNGVIDSYVFGPQSSDVSEGRQTDGGLPWVFFTTPTPGASNAGTVTPESPIASLRLLPCYPNPFNPSTRLSFDLPASGQASLFIFDVRGRRVATILDGWLSDGRHEADWDGRDDAGRSLTSGVYFSLLRYGDEEKSERMVLLR